MVSKEESIHCVLKAVQEYGFGVTKEVLTQIITDLNYSTSLINQLIYYGFISRAKNAKLSNRSTYHLTEKGFEVLQACEKL